MKQVDRLDVWLTKPLTRAHDGGDHTGVSPRYFTPDEANEALDVVRPLTEELVEHRRLLAAFQDQQAELTARIAGNGGDLEPRELQEVQERLDFAERVLTQVRDRPGLGAGPSPDQ